MPQKMSQPITTELQMPFMYNVEGKMQMVEPVDQYSPGGKVFPSYFLQITWTRFPLAIPIMVNGIQLFVRPAQTTMQGKWNKNMETL